MKKKKALITGITGQDGSYLARFLLKKNYIVHGVKRKSSSFNSQRIDDIYVDPHNSTNFFLHYGDLTDHSSIIKLIEKIKPDEVYNLAAQSHVATSFEMPISTCEINAIGTLNILSAIKEIQNKKRIKFYQASSSEMFGLIQNKKQNEKTPFYPQSPYATSKLFAYWITKNYREAYNIYACNGILFNHESPMRGETFVTRKITMTLSKISFGLEKCLYLGNLNSLRDWGHADEYVEAMWKMLQQKKPDDYVVATGKQYTVRDFVNKVCKYLEIKIKWSGKGSKEVGTVMGINEKITPKIKIGSIIVKVDKKYFRPLDVVNLIGDSTKSRKKLNWNPKKDISKLVADMVNNDYKVSKENFILLNHFKKK